MHGENADAGILVKRLQEARQAPEAGTECT